MLTHDNLHTADGFIFVHFEDRNKIERTTDNLPLKIGNLTKLSRGISVDGTTLYIFAEKQYFLYEKDFFINNTIEKIKSLPEHKRRKDEICKEYI